jgi:DNA-binding LytR/AlgR family response regulator
MALIDSTSPVAFIRCDGELIAREAIIWLEGDMNYTHIHQCSQPTKTSARTLKWYAGLLANFIRVRRDAMVNPAHIRAIHKADDQPGRLKLLLSNGVAVDVARRRLAGVRQQLKAEGFGKATRQ